MDGTPLPPSFQPSNMEAQADSVRARMQSTRHDEQLRDAERADQERKQGRREPLRARIARWLRRER